MYSFEVAIVALIVVGELYVLYRVVPNLVREARVLASQSLNSGSPSPPSPAVTSAPNFVSNSPNLTNSSAHNRTIQQPKIQPVEPPKPVIDTPKVSQEPTLKPTSSHSAVPIGAIHIPASCDNYYEVLAILPDSSESEIKAAYRSLIKIWHPDTSRLPDAQASMSAITEAYECLSQADTRKLYDEGLKLQANL